jgi:hypothetical protein
MRQRFANLLRGMAVTTLVLLALSVAARAEEEKEHKFIGVKKCGMCHKSEAKGNQLGQWEKSQHSKAFETLASEEAMKVAKEAGIEGSPQEADACLKCHVTGHGKPAEMFGTSFVAAQGVQCESCHGAGDGYKSMKLMKDREQSVAAGLVIPDETTCTGCHNKESPTFKGFDFEKMWAQIQHPNPKNKSAPSE